MFMGKKFWDSFVIMGKRNGANNEVFIITVIINGKLKGLTQIPPND